jgi:hypothetical protein
MRKVGNIAHGLFFAPETEGCFQSGQFPVDGSIRGGFCEACVNVLFKPLVGDLLRPHVREKWR